MPTIIAAIDDLMFQSRLEAQARSLGYDVTIADTTDRVARRARRPAAARSSCSTCTRERSTGAP